MSRLTISLGIFWIVLAIILFVSQYLIPAKIEVTWETESEFDTVGYNILRSDSTTGQFLRINDKMITGSADPAVGGSYEFIDSNVNRGQKYYYRLEDIEYDNTVGTHETIEASVEERSWWIAVLVVVCAFIGIVIIFEAYLSTRGQQ